MDERRRENGSGGGGLLKVAAGLVSYSYLVLLPVP